MPAELGGDGRGTNPEQLFAAGFAACFHGALSLVARQEERDPTPISEEATVAFGRDPGDGGMAGSTDDHHAGVLTDLVTDPPTARS
ncbi:OsmC family protein [Streptomyces sp. AS02]|uniref:OsmC family protein n=1 Tax=Streptomyces sp. AS02 TaxID=2938946 RepID=UPI0027B8A7C0|nr:OsmC family protein [Streptomyces sp. AS02]